MLKKISILVSALSAVAQAGKCPFGYGSNAGSNAQVEAVQLSDHAPLLELDEDERALIDELDEDQSFIDLEAQTTSQALNARYPHEIFQCEKTEALQTDVNVFKKNHYIVLTRQMWRLLDAEDGKFRTERAACWVRFSGHDFMDFRRGKGGGSDACINFEDEDNKGLPKCTIESGLPVLYKRWCDRISLADFIVITGEAAVTRLSPEYKVGNWRETFKKGTWAQKLRDGFRAGRVTNKKCTEEVGLMPNAEEGCGALQHIFIDNIYHSRWKKGSWLQLVAINGAHTIGSAKLENSGYQGRWSDKKNSGIWNADYYKAILTHGWGPDRAINGNKNKNAWKRVDFIQLSDPSEQELMLNTDMCLGWQYNTQHATCMKKHRRNRKKCLKFQKKGTNNLNAKDHQCCAWVCQESLIPGKIIKRMDNEYCGMKNATWGDLRGVCCKFADESGPDAIGDCDDFGWPKGPGFDFIWWFASKPHEWQKWYLKAWHRATTNGQRVKPLVWM